MFFNSKNEFLSEIWTDLLLVFHSNSQAFSANDTVVPKHISPSCPKISCTICFDCFSGNPILFLSRFRFSSKCRVQRVNFASVKLDFTALTSSFSSSDPTIKLLVLIRFLAMVGPELQQNG